MTAENRICDSCLLPSENLLRVRRGGSAVTCLCCNGWVRMSLRRTRRVPAWIRPSPDMDAEVIVEMREEFLRMRDHQGQDRWAERRMIFELGFSYLGPLNEQAWSLALHSLRLQGGAYNGNLPYLPTEEIDEELSKLSDVGVVHLPTNLVLRKQIAHLLRGDLGLGNKRRLITALSLWLIDDNEFRGRNVEPWARSFQFLQEVVKDLGERAEFVDDYIRIIGTSGNVYRISPRPHPPFYVVSRDVAVDDGGGRRPTICIDPVNANSVVFGDILVNLVLALCDDEMSARHIDTLARHVFGMERHSLRRRREHGARPANIEHLWRRALGNMPGEDVAENNRELFRQWRNVIDRFQTNLADWTEEEEEE